MIIENSEEFKAWIAAVLEPICDADPQALAKYICALVKKDKPTEEFYKTLLSQLEVFLEGETTEFVNFLFAKLKTSLKDENTYYFQVKEEVEGTLKTVENSMQESSNQEASSSLVDELVTLDESQSEQPSNQEIIEEEKTNGTPEFCNESPRLPRSLSQNRERHSDTESPESPKVIGGASKSGWRPKSLSRSRERQSDPERDDKERFSVRRRNSSGSSPYRRIDKARSRSRSWDKQRGIHARRSRSRSRRSRSRGRDRIAAWRNKSPPQRRHGRKLRSWSKSPPARSHSRTPPPKTHHYSRYKSRTFVSTRSRSLHHTRSPPNDSPHNTGGESPNQDSGQGDDVHMTPVNQLQSVVTVKEPLPTKTRCRDYEEKGFCMRGEMCPYDHGNDPVVLEDVGQVLNFSAPPPSLLEAPVPGIGLPLLRPAIIPHHPSHSMSRPPPNISEYNPDAPSMEPRMWSKPQFRSTGQEVITGGAVMAPPPMMPHQRELISVHTDQNSTFFASLPFGNANNKRHCPPEFNINDGQPPMKQKFDYNRLGMRKNNSSLHIRKIPPGMNTIAHIHNHFVKFGTIVNLQVNFGGAPDAALVTFSSHAEASAAYKCTEAVLNNRFIKVFWYNGEKDSKQENISPQLNRLPAKDRLGSIVNTVTNESPRQQLGSDSNEKVIMSGTNITKTFYIPQEQAEIIRKVEAKKMIVTATNFQNAQDVLAVKEAVQKRKEKMQMNALLTIEYTQKKRDILEKLIAKQEELTEQLEKGKFTSEQRTQVLNSLKELQASIETFNNNNTKAPAVAGPSTLQVTPQLVKKSIEQTKKEILDAELELMTKEQEGTDALELNKTIYQLKSKAHNLGKLVKNNYNPKRFPQGVYSRYRTIRGQQVYNPHVTVDHRPTKLLVSGFESDDKAEIIDHFSKFGEVVEHLWDDATPALVIEYKTRKEAEIAMAKGRNFQDRLMSITWFSSTQNKGARNKGMRSVVLVNEEHMSEHMSDREEDEEALRLDTTEDLLLQEEDDEEDEERTWRR